MAPTDEHAYEPIPQTAQLAAAAVVLENESAKIAISQRGRCEALIDKRTGKNHILRSTPLVSIQQDGHVFSRARCSFDQGKLTLQFDKPKTTVVVRVTTRPKYFKFQVESISTPGIDKLTLVQINLKPCKFTHPMSGLAADDEFAVCMRALTLETDVRVGGNPPVLTAITSAENGLTKNSVALATCPTPEMRQVLQEIVRAEKLPFSALGGPFALDAEEIRSSYVFATVSEDNVDRWIELARRGGIRYIHFSGWQNSLGHYAPRESLFPHGLDGVKAVVDKIHAAGLKAGMHTLTGCISPDDPWVTPIPDPGLATDGKYELASDLQIDDSNVPIAEIPDQHPTIWAYSSRGNCIRIDNELIQYSVIEQGPKRGFFNCQRGAFGTRAAAPSAWRNRAPHVRALWLLRARRTRFSCRRCS